MGDIISIPCPFVYIWVENVEPCAAKFHIHDSFPTQKCSTLSTWIMLYASSELVFITAIPCTNPPIIYTLPQHLPTHHMSLYCKYNLNLLLQEPLQKRCTPQNHAKKDVPHIYSRIFIWKDVQDHDSAADSHKSNIYFKFWCSFMQRIYSAVDPLKKLNDKTRQEVTSDAHWNRKCLFHHFGSWLLSSLHKWAPECKKKIVKCFLERKEQVGFANLVAYDVWASVVVKCIELGDWRMGLWRQGI